MSYLRFHALFNFPLLVVLSYLNFLVERWSRGEIFALVVVLSIVMAFTTPWDNAAAKWGVWGFPKDRVLAWIGYLPVEEYAFFFLQSMNVMLLTRWFLEEFSWHTGVEAPLSEIPFAVLLWFPLAWFILGLILFRWRRPLSWTYAIHLFFWFGPVVLLQWLLVPEVLLAHLGLIAIVTIILGTYYTVADVFAVNDGTWFFDKKLISGVKIGVLPWEEAAFFYLTSLLVCQSFLLLLPPGAR